LLFLGGHDHDIDWVETDTQVPIMKNKSNLETVPRNRSGLPWRSAYFQLRGAALELENTRFVSLPAKESSGNIRSPMISPLIRYPEAASNCWQNFLPPMRVYSGSHGRR